ncbi:MAG: carboxypeptidase-like regulatory domain-containing protein, partial [Pirellulales bacterium]
MTLRSSTLRSSILRSSILRNAILCSSLAIVALTAAVGQGGDLAEAACVAISGRVVDGQSRGVPGVQVRGLAYTDVTEATTDDDGRFVLNVVEQRVTQLVIIAADAQGDRLGTYMAPWKNPLTAKTPIEIPLVACRRLPVAVTDAAGKPAPGVRVGAVIFNAPLVSVITDAAGAGVLKLPAGAEIQQLYATKRGVGFDYRVVKTPRDESYQAEWFNEPPIRFQLASSQIVRIQLVDTAEHPITGTEVYLWLLNKPDEPDSFNLTFTPTEFRATTDDTGVAEFRGVPDWNVYPLIFRPTNDQYVDERIEFDPREHPDGRLTVKLDRLVPMTGRVRFADGRPAPSIKVNVAGSGYKTDGFREDATTDGRGDFHLRVAPDLLYMLVVQDDRWAAAAIDGLVVRPGVPVEGLEFELRRSARVHGRVTVGPDEKPVAGQQVALRQKGRDLHNLEGAKLPNPDGSNRWVQPSVYRRAITDEEGRYQFSVGPGKFTLSGPSQLKAERFEVVDQSELVFNFAAPRPEKGPFAGQVVTGDPPRPVAEAIIEGKYRAFVGRDLRLRADTQGRFAGERLLHITVLRAMSHDGRLAGIVQI